MRKLIDPAYTKHPGFYSRGKAICGHAVNLPFCALSDEREEKKAAISNQYRRRYHAEHARAHGPGPESVSQSVSQSVLVGHGFVIISRFVSAAAGKKVRVLHRRHRRHQYSERCFEVLNVRVCPLRWSPPLSAAFYRPCRTSDNKSI